MATSTDLCCVSFPAARDLSSYQFHFVSVATDGQVDYVQSAGALADGVLQNDPAAENRSATVALLNCGGIAKVVCSDTSITAIGDDVSSSTTGTAIKATTGHAILAKALEVGASGKVIEVLLGYRGVK